jgi:hypothetical protein
MCELNAPDLGCCRRHGPLHGRLHYRRRNPEPYFSREDHVTKIMPIHPPTPRGTVFGEQVGGWPSSEAEHYFKCRFCGGYFDARDWGWIEEHLGPLPHPAQDGIQ